MARPCGAVSKHAVSNECLRSKLGAVQWPYLQEETGRRIPPLVSGTGRSACANDEAGRDAWSRARSPYSSSFSICCSRSMR